MTFSNGVFLGTFVASALWVWILVSALDGRTIGACQKEFPGASCVLAWTKSGGDK